MDIHKILVTRKAENDLKATLFDAKSFQADDGRDKAIDRKALNSDFQSLSQSLKAVNLSLPTVKPVSALIKDLKRSLHALKHVSVVVSN